MVLDQATGLIWQRCAVGQTWSGSSCTGIYKTYTFGGAKSAAEQANQQKLGGYSDWRVPTVRELASLMDCHGLPTKESGDPQDGGEAIKNLCYPGDGGPHTWNLNTFGTQPMEAPWFWSSSARKSSGAWVVNFQNGYVGFGFNRDSSGAVRLVRASQLSGDAAASGFVTAIAADTEGARLVADPALRAAAEAKAAQAAAEKAAKAVATAAADNERQAALIRMTSSGKTGQGPFVAHQSGTMVLDKATGLIWQRCAVGQTWSGSSCTGDYRRYQFDQTQSAVAQANQQQLGGYSDWRLPTIRELASLIDCHGVRYIQTYDLNDGGGAVPAWCRSSKIPYWNRKAFGMNINDSNDDNYNYLWSSTRSPWNGINVISFSDADIGSLGMSKSLWVRLVRSSQSLGSSAVLGFVTDIPVDLTEEQQSAARAKAQEEAGRRRDEENRRQQAEFERRTAAFRKSVSPGDDTSEGVVVEVKGGLVKIQTNNSQCSQRDYKGNCTNYINTPAEKWVKRSDIFPAR